MEDIQITSAKYVVNMDKVKVSINASFDGTEMCIPLDPNNRHYAEILKQVKEGTLTIQDAD
tara:strand:- start:209 stop:391 length:183 start_codon:yes stop_codon:yes gene_type:complete